MLIKLIKSSGGIVNTLASILSILGLTFVGLILWVDNAITNYANALEIAIVFITFILLCGLTYVAQKMYATIAKIDSHLGPQSTSKSGRWSGVYRIIDVEEYIAAEKTCDAVLIITEKMKFEGMIPKIAEIMSDKILHQIKSPHNGNLTSLKYKIITTVKCRPAVEDFLTSNILQKLSFDERALALKLMLSSIPDEYIGLLRPYPERSLISINKGTEELICFDVFQIENGLNQIYEVGPTNDQQSHEFIDSFNKLHTQQK